MEITAASATHKPLTPLMTQYLEVKSRHQDALLFFRMGDFYELFFDDAKVASRILEIALTSRNKNDPDPVPMCGVPHHSATHYVNKLVSCGYKVALCEQLEDPSQAKGIVRRDVTKVITPGTQLDPEALDAKSLNLTHAFYKADTEIFWASCDFSTGAMTCGALPQDAWLDLLATSHITEMIYDPAQVPEEMFQALSARQLKIYSQPVAAFYFDHAYATARVQEQFETNTLESVHTALAIQPRLVEVVGALIKHFQDTQKALRIPLTHKITLYSEEQNMELSPAALEALELLPPHNPAGLTAHTSKINLFNLLDRTKTAMGGRLLKSWLLKPLLSVSTIKERLTEVEACHALTKSLPETLSQIYDMERLMARISLNAANARDLRNLADSVLQACILHEELATRQDLPASLRDRLTQALAPALKALAQQVLDALEVELPAHLREGGLFRRGVSPALDELIGLSENGAQWLAEFEAQEKKSTKIASLKVRFNKVFGYYIEITKTNLGSVPPHYVRKQTTATGERYITDELKTFEDKILNAEKRRHDLEYEMFKELCERFARFHSEVSCLATSTAHLDCCVSLAAVAQDQGYVKPVVDDSLVLEIHEGRHPTVELRGGFVPNSVTLDSHGKNFMLITGPNMGGKSTVMRQTALIVLMAQMGSFVPATSARIGVCDRIFTRIGAADNIARGQSTFMVEMSEMSFIIRNATERSLIVVDEIGRGTSTYDGLSLAWALALELLQRTGPRTLFATHYHELTELASAHPQVFNMRVGVTVSRDKEVRFLYRLEEGAAARSYGIHVAKLAGLPPRVISRAEQILQKLESRKSARAAETLRVRTEEGHDSLQLEMF